MLCIGYGRFPPQSLTDMWLTMLSMIRYDDFNLDSLLESSFYHCAFLSSIKVRRP